MKTDLVTVMEHAVNGTLDTIELEWDRRTAMGVVISQAMNSTSMQVNLIDAFGTATESNVGMSFYNQDKGGLEYNFVHTMNDRGLPDTLTIEPTIKYKIVVHTMPPVIKENVELQPGRHNVIPIDVPQSNLQLTVTGLMPGERVECLVKKAGEPNGFLKISFKGDIGNRKPRVESGNRKVQQTFRVGDIEKTERRRRESDDSSAFKEI